MSRANFSATHYSSYAARQFDQHNASVSNSSANNSSDSNQGASKPVLQHCENCGAVQYPSREVCRSCLSGELLWKPIDDDIATVVSNTVLHHSLEEHYLERMPWHILAVQFSPSLKLTGSILVHSAKPLKAGEKVRLVAVCDYSGASTLLAVSPGEDANVVWQQLSDSKPI